MNPYSPTGPRAEFRAQQQYSAPVWNGDKIFAYIEIGTTLLGVLLVFLIAGPLQQLATQTPAQNASEEMKVIRPMIFGVIAITSLVTLVIEWVVLSGIWRGKQWGYLVMTCLLGIGSLSSVLRVLTGAYSSSTAHLCLILFTMVVSIGKLVFCGLRLSGKVGPSLN